MKVYVLNTLGAGVEVIEALRKSSLLQGVIGLTTSAGVPDAGSKISGFIDMEKFCLEENLPFIPLTSYSISAPEDRTRLSKEDIDLLIVAGWQRLIPGWLIDNCRECAIGLHGSHDGIEGGRGRSPQNWALILGKDKFHISIFKLTPAADDGDIIATQSYHLYSHDDIQTSYYKSSLLFAKMVSETLKSGSWKNALPQNSAEARYLPQRLPEDGEIDWARRSTEIHGFVRALTRPYPGAFCFFNEDTIRIWRGVPMPECTSQEPGTILRVYPDGDFLVQTGKGAFLVQDYEIDGGSTHIFPRENIRLKSTDFHTQMREIINRHQKRYPDQLLAEDILRTIEHRV